MGLSLYQVDAFTDEVFRGNPAAVVPMEAFPSDDVLHGIAQENNLSDTAYVVATPDDPSADFHLRWFTPGEEVALCGHATLATAHVLFSHLGFEGNAIRFQSMSGVLSVSRSGDKYEMDFPALDHEEIPVSEDCVAALGGTPTAMYSRATKTDGTQYDMALFDRAEQIRGLAPDFGAFDRAGLGCLIVTAPGDTPGVDFVSRFFAPGIGINEDPVTGSAHCILTPFWSQRLGKNATRANQISARGGDLECELAGDRVRLRGGAVTYMIGKITAAI